MPKHTKAIIVGAGPAGLTAAYELLEKTDIKPIVYETSDVVGGICRTIEHNGNRIDIGGHRFFSKSDRVMQWWKKILPLQKLDTSETITYQKKTRHVRATEGPDPEIEDKVMLLRQRKSRIYFLRQFFDYPLQLNVNTLRKLGPWRTVRIGASYLKSSFFPMKEEKNLEQFFINRFGKELYETFFKSYTEKVWGMPCNMISAEWGAQRIKGLSLKKALLDFFLKLSKNNDNLKQKETETSLIEQFLYPKYGPGQMWQEVALRIKDMGGQIMLKKHVVGFEVVGKNLVSVTIMDTNNKRKEKTRGDYFFSTMPVKELILAFGETAPQAVQQVAHGLVYRDFIAVGLLLKELQVHDAQSASLSDNWIYVQEPEVKLGRIQIFNNWSPYMVRDPKTIWVGLEYFCNEGDALWQKSDQEMKAFAIDELEKIGIIHGDDVLDDMVIKMKKTYPAYFGTYNRFDQIRQFTDQFENLFLIGRNGMHKYNNQDHSMLTAMVAVENIIKGETSKDNIWKVNTEAEYHEEKST